MKEITHETNDKWTKKDILIAIGLNVVVYAVIVLGLLIGNALGIPEFQF